MIKRAVLYARVSGDDPHREDPNLRSQLDMCRERAENQGWQVVAELSEDDRGAKSAAFELPQLDRVREMARNHECDVLVVRELDRLSRSLAKQLFVEEELKRCGVEIEYVLDQYADTPEGSLMKNVKASVAEYERLRVTERVVRGRQLKVRSGSVLVQQRPPYGYRVIETNGKWVLEVNEDEARIVRMVFDWYTVGDGSGGHLDMRRIQARLTEMRVPTLVDLRNPGVKKRGLGEWGVSSVQKMLSNETYVGTWHYRVVSLIFRDEVAGR
jgi:site-specific DNA recombinase